MSKLFFLENKHLKATFKTQGAELTSLFGNGIEYIWTGDKAFWNRHTPVLFPFVGSEKDNTYIYKKTKYSIGQHGFARDREFNITEHSKTSITFQLTSDVGSLKIYPFAFILELKYTLVGKTLTTSYRVKNPQQENIYFSIGAHPAFKCPFETSHQREDYSIEFDTFDTPESQTINDGLRTDESYAVFKKEGFLDLTKNIFDKDALVFNPNPFSKASFIHNPSGKTYLSIEFKNFPYLGIWSKNQESPFVCIEPWHGIADHENHNQELTQKEGIILLKKKESFHCEYLINIH